MNVFISKSYGWMSYLSERKKTSPQKKKKNANKPNPLRNPARQEQGHHPPTGLRRSLRRALHATRGHGAGEGRSAEHFRRQFLYMSFVRLLVMSMWFRVLQKLVLRAIVCVGVLS